ncbi:NAD(P)-dependent oxidoreductase [Vibrio sp. WJH972]
MNSYTSAIDATQESALDELFTDINPALTDRQANIESSRCYYCYDAPCIKACPSDINIPSFISSIHNGDLEGAAKTIYDNNILGGSCARVCPTEILCEQSCVRNKEEECSPVLIGLLQRHATDNAKFTDHPVNRNTPTGKTIAVVGGGPAGLSCAHRLSMLGNDVEIFEAESKAGGLNEYGIAKYKLTNNFAQKEVDFILSIGGITLHTNTALGRDIELTELTERFDAVFISIGLQGTRALGLEGEETSGVYNAVDFIKELRQAEDIDKLDVPKNSAVVIGAGNTAIDIACQLKRLGTEEVTLVYRRGYEHMTATEHEQQIAKNHEVRIKTWSRPEAITFTDDGKVSGMVFQKTALKEGKLIDLEQQFDVPCEAIFKAVGQTLTLPESKQWLPEMSGGKLFTTDNFQTNLNNVFAGGDCTSVGEDLTVEAVQQGKLAAIAINEQLTIGANIIAEGK